MCRNEDRKLHLILRSPKPHSPEDGLWLKPGVEDPPQVYHAVTVAQLLQLECTLTES